MANTELEIDGKKLMQGFTKEAVAIRLFYDSTRSIESRGGTRKWRLPYGTIGMEGALKTLRDASMANTGTPVSGGESWILVGIILNLVQ